LLDNNVLLDAILGAPNYNINNFLIIKNNNTINKLVIELNSVSVMKT
jgi:hypothetical protein